MGKNQRGIEFDSLHAAERERIGKHREHRGATTQRWTGLAISGGGIRSASFGLGVLQALARDKYRVLDRIDYLSTVSGGGYIGSALSWLNHLQEGREWRFPLGIPGQGARSQNRRTALDYIRQHGDYLTPGNSLSAISLLGTVLRNTLLTSAVYFMLLLGLMFAGLWSGMLADPFKHPEGAAQQCTNVCSWSLYAVLLAIALFVTVTVGYALISFFEPAFRLRDYIARITVQRALGWLLTLGIAAALLASLPAVHALIGSAKSLVSGGVASSAGAVGGIYEFMRQRAAGFLAKAPGRVRILVTALLLIYGLLLLAYSIAVLDPAGSGHGVSAVYCLAAGLVFGFFLDTNYFGLGRMYRDRLMETFLPDEDTIESGIWSPAKQADSARLRDMCGERGRGPYHLVNCNLVTVDSTEAKFRGRGGDSFLLSPLYCGSNATGWYKTGEFLRNGMTLGTAMAISGAAANPNTGVAGRGPTRDRLVSFLMAFLGLRLGYWAWNPSITGLRRFLVSRLFRPNLLYPGIVQGLLGQQLHEKAGYLELSDGGHFENTGLYELARRRLDVIIVSDAGADPEFSMSDLGDAIERIRVDFGYYIYFDDAEFNLPRLMPGSAPGTDDFAKAYGIAEHGFAVGRIEYDEHHTGRIIYIKATMIRDLPADVFAYRKANTDFPHQSTVDQFFDEVQLEAYRELGYRLCKQLLERNLEPDRNWV